MNVHTKPAKQRTKAKPATAAPVQAAANASPIAPDCSGQDFYALDAGLQQLLALYLPADTRAHLEPHFERLGALAGGRLDELARMADANGPVLHARDRFGRDEDWIEYHPSYREMEAIAFGDFQFHAMSHRAGVLGLDAPLPPVAKYACQYLFVQGEFGIMCPISVTDTSIYLLRKYASPELKAYLLAAHAVGRPGRAVEGHAVHDREGRRLRHRPRSRPSRRNEGGTWRLTGEKWFCSHADADVALMLARPEGAPEGTRGLALFALPRRLEDGSRNSYRIVRLKDKLGTRSMASGEIMLEGAVAYPVGRLDQGLKQMMDQVNLSRLSHGVRAAAMMRRCVNEALTVARHRVAFGKPIIEHPLLRRQLMKLMVPAEQALSHDHGRRGRHGRGRRGLGRGRRGAAHPDPARQVPRLPRQRHGRHRGHGGARRQRLHRGVGQRPPDPRRPGRPAVGGHQQHQCAGRDRPRGRQSHGRTSRWKRCCAAA